MSFKKCLRALQMSKQTTVENVREKVALRTKEKFVNHEMCGMGINCATDALSSVKFACKVLTTKKRWGKNSWTAKNHLRLMLPKNFR